MARYAVGIDLGTTHSGVSYLNLESGEARGTAQAMLPIPQLIAPGTVDARQLLPSFLYLAAEQEFAPGALALPWEPDAREVVGELARTHGTRVPARLVSSAKSWLCNPSVDRTAPLLPWNAPEDVKKVSPLDATARYLRHLRAAFEKGLGVPLADQDLVLTVPASFDAAARELTLLAAKQAGLPTPTLLEEPQAALYAWLEAAGDGFRKQVSVGDVILVVDVGGGTTDLSLISVTEVDGELELTRLAVGDHILLGGDNMDLALAYHLAGRFKEQGKTLDAAQMHALTHAARQAKETLFADPSLSSAPVALASRGASLMGGTLRAELTRDDLDRLLLEGFFPPVPVTEAPKAARRTGLTQMSLPYAQDAAITRHLAAFLTRQARSLEDSRTANVRVEGRAFLHPTAVLFNGGVFKAPALKARLREVLNVWTTADGGRPVKELTGSDLDLSVARGASYYGWVRKGHGVRIRGGTAHAYYVGVETAMMAVPGMEPPMKALCVAPFGMEEGSAADIPPQEFGLVVGEPTRFRFFSSATRRDDRVGTFIDDVEREEGLDEEVEIETSLPPGPQQPPGQVVPVNLQAAITEIGTLELRCLEKGGPGAWKLELNLRQKDRETV